jgi:hypothetical protein
VCANGCAIKRRTGRVNKLQEAKQCSNKVRSIAVTSLKHWLANLLESVMPETHDCQNYLKQIYGAFYFMHLSLSPLLSILSERLSYILPHSLEIAFHLL